MKSLPDGDRKFLIFKKYKYWHLDLNDIFNNDKTSISLLQKPPLPCRAQVK